MSNQAVDVEILGKLTRVNCPPGQEESLIAAAADLDNRLTERMEQLTTSLSDVLSKVKHGQQ